MADTIIDIKSSNQVKEQNNYICCINISNDRFIPLLWIIEILLILSGIIVAKNDHSDLIKIIIITCSLYGLMFLYKLFVCVIATLYNSYENKSPCEFYFLTLMPIFIIVSYGMIYGICRCLFNSIKKLKN